MIGALIGGLGILAGGVMVAHWLAHASPRQARWAAVSVLAALGAGLALFLAITGRLAWALAALPALIPWVRRVMWAARQAGMGGGGGRNDDRSAVETDSLTMTLDHLTGAMEGMVKQGAHAGARLDELSAPVLLSLLRQWRTGDPDAARLLEAWLDRTQGEAWRTWQEEDAAPSGNEAMTPAQARQILGVDETADTAAILAAHRRLLQRVHPDHGGSHWLAARINQARDLLLGR